MDQRINGSMDQRIEGSPDFQNPRVSKTLTSQWLCSACSAAFHVRAVSSWLPARTWQRRWLIRLLLMLFRREGRGVQGPPQARYVVMIRGVLHFVLVVRIFDRC